MGKGGQRPDEGPSALDSISDDQALKNLAQEFQRNFLMAVGQTVFKGGHHVGCRLHHIHFEFHALANKLLAVRGTVSRRSSGALWFLLSADGASFSWLRRVQCHGGANERLQRLFINLVALMEIYGTPHVAFEAGVEEA
jgi:hypothetical protein